MDGIRRNALMLANLIRSRAFALSLLSVLMAMIVYKVTDTINVVTIHADGDATTVYTISSDPAEILADNGVVTLAYDAVDTESLDGKLTEIKVSHTFPAYVECDGKTRKIMILGGTVEELLSRTGIELGEHDEVSMELTEEVSPEDVVVVTRKEFVTVTEEEPIPFDTIYTYHPDLTPGVEKVSVEGEEGVKVEVLSRVLVDGEVARETVESQEIAKEPVNEEVLMGFPAKPVSSFDFEAEFDMNCEPLEYVEVFREQKSAGYSAPSGAGTASGRKAVVGNVAVNPNVIPYGTKMFIKSSDGKHIYGYAVAADTGTALMQGRITVDLLYGSYGESAANGIRNVDIFILEWGNG